jgi:hypothetical protein
VLLYPEWQVSLIFFIFRILRNWLGFLSVKNAKFDHLFINKKILLDRAPFNKKSPKFIKDH